jgi:hydrogenase maturation factor
VGAGIGQDAAVIDVGADEMLVLASDPITLAMDSLARYVVIANANDVATSGADPRWLLTTLMFPSGATASEILSLAAEIQEICASCGVSLCGGHTEITDAVSRPLAVGTMAGTTRADRVLDKSKMRPGDRVLLTKGVAVEGTGLIAREYPSRLIEAGMSPEEIQRCAAFLDHISILEEARICHASAAVTALHDVTEGGLATALSELGAAGGFRLRVDMDAIPVYQETTRICMAMGLDPFGLIGSGSLLITCHSSGAADLVAAIERQGIRVTEIGEVLEPGTGIESWKGGVQVEWPQFSRDEVSRLSGIVK